MAEHDSFDVDLAAINVEAVATDNVQNIADSEDDRDKLLNFYVSI